MTTSYVGIGTNKHRKQTWTVCTKSRKFSLVLLKLVVMARLLQIWYCVQLYYKSEMIIYLFMEILSDWYFRPHLEQVAPHASTMPSSFSPLSSSQHHPHNYSCSIWNNITDILLTYFWLVWLWAFMVWLWEVIVWSQESMLHSWVHGLIMNSRSDHDKHGLIMSYHGFIMRVWSDHEMSWSDCESSWYDHRGGHLDLTKTQIGSLWFPSQWFLCGTFISITKCWHIPI